MSWEVDHLVVAARRLDEGIVWCEATLGIIPGTGGAHPLMGTHNRVFAIGSARCPRSYLEIIAIDPAAPAPGRKRWFDLDDSACSRARCRRSSNGARSIRPRACRPVASRSCRWL